MSYKKTIFKLYSEMGESLVYWHDVILYNFLFLIATEKTYINVENLFAEKTIIILLVLTESLT